MSKKVSWKAIELGWGGYGVILILFSLFGFVTLFDLIVNYSPSNLVATSLWMYVLLTIAGLIVGLGYASENPWLVTKK